MQFEQEVPILLSRHNVIREVTVRKIWCYPINTDARRRKDRSSRLCIRYIAKVYKPLILYAIQ